MSEQDKLEAIASHIKEIIRLVGEAPEREGLVKTPLRSAKALLHATSGYTSDISEAVNRAVFEHDGNGMVMVRDIEFYSLCEHHILPFFGNVSVAYLPHGRILGLSKLARIVDHCARRLQLQERLTQEIARMVSEAVGSPDVMVTCRAGHLCMKMRGVEKQEATTVTVEALGRFESDATLRADFLAAAR